MNRFFIEYRSLEEYAAILNITPNHLSTVIKAVGSKSPKAFLDERMITESKNLLIYSADTISEIAYKLSFSEPTHFIRFLKKKPELRLPNSGYSLRSNHLKNWSFLQ